MLYRINIMGTVSKDNKKLIFSSDVERSTDGEEWTLVANFIDKFIVEMDDATIRQHIIKRANTLAEVDANRIEKTDLQARATAIAEALDGQTKEI